MKEIVDLREEYFPNAKFCAVENLQRLLNLLYDDRGMMNPKAHNWMFVAHYVELSSYNKETRKYEKEECKVIIIIIIIIIARFNE